LLFFGDVYENIRDDELQLYIIVVFIALLSNNYLHCCVVIVQLVSTEFSAMLRDTAPTNCSSNLEHPPVAAALAVTTNIGYKL
jgi:hypothetical protein